jgi:hypothetical protein
MSVGSRGMALSLSMRGSLLASATLWGSQGCADEQEVKLGIPLTVVWLVAGCAGLGATPQATPNHVNPATFARVKVRVARDMAIVTEGTVPGTLREDLVRSVEDALRAQGFMVVYGDLPRDLTVRIETRVSGALSFLRGHLTLVARHGETLVAQKSTGTQTHRDRDFSTRVATLAVQGLVGNPGFLAFAQRLAPVPPRQAPTQARPRSAPLQTRPRAEPVNLMALAKAHSRRGAAFFNLARYRDALPEYEKAYLAVSDPPFLFNIAQCHRKLGNQEEALKFYRNYLRVAPHAPNRADVERWMRELQRSKHAAR